MLIRGALRLGVRVADLEYFTVGSLLDLLLYEPSGEEGVKQATQADFDAF